MDDTQRRFERPSAASIDLRSDSSVMVSFFGNLQKGEKGTKQNARRRMKIQYVLY